MLFVDFEMKEKSGEATIDDTPNVNVFKKFLLNSIDIFLFIYYKFTRMVSSKKERY